MLPDITWQAYNLFPEDGRDGASLYHAWDELGRLLGEEDAAVTVSFDRPYAGAGLPLHIGHAYDFIRWAERYGYDLAYADARDLHAAASTPRPTAAWSSPATTSTGRCPCAAPSEAPATAARRLSSSRPTPCSGRSS